MIGIAIIGCGFISRLHLSALTRLIEEGRAARLVAAVDVVERQADRLAREFAIDRVYTDYHRALEDSDVAAVIICTSNRTHRDIAVAAARAGKHIFLEKPIALTLEEADEIVAACAEAGVKLMVGQSMRFDPINRELKALAESGDIGEIVHVSTTNWSGYFWPGGWGGWQIDPSQSGGNLVQNGIHDLDLFAWLMRSVPSAVFARGLKLASPSLDTFDHYHVSVCFPDGSTALSSYSYSLVPPDAAVRTLAVIGTDGEARYETTADGGLWRTAGPSNEVLPGPFLYYRELEHWLDCLEHDREPLVTPAQARLALELALAAESSAQTGEVVSISERAYV